MLNEDFLNFLSTKVALDKDLIEDEFTDSNQSGKISLKNFLISRRYITENRYQSVLAEFLDVEFKEDLAEPDATSKEIFTTRVSHKMAYKYLFFLVSKSKKTLTFAAVDFECLPICEELSGILGLDFTILLTLESNVLNLIQKEYKIGLPENLEQDEDSKNLDSFIIGEGEDLLIADNEEPIKRLVNSILFQASKVKASDIHIDPEVEQTVARNRMDGVLHQTNIIPKHAHNRIVNRVKVMAGLDISTRNVPQDGRTMIKLAGKKVDIRVSIIPTVNGERIVMRLLQQSHQLLKIEDIDLDHSSINLLKSAVNSPNGIVLVTGPTGSGKTTTLYACLQSVDHNARNVITVEDPVEYQISGYGQVQVNEKQGLTFSAGLRSILRQDPDVIMVGEIRDTETAKIAIQSALTGHLVLSTLHTNDASSTVIRLIDMGIEPFLISSTLKCVVSQRLVRRICKRCFVKVPKTWDDFKDLNLGKKSETKFKGYVYEEKGCKECSGSGYRGRVAVHEILSINDKVRALISTNCTASSLYKTALESGALAVLADDCYSKVFSGETTVNEVSKLLFELQQEKETTALA